MSLLAASETISAKATALRIRMDCIYQVFSSEGGRRTLRRLRTREQSRPPLNDCLTTKQVFRPHCLKARKQGPSRQKVIPWPQPRPGDLLDNFCGFVRSLTHSTADPPALRTEDD